MKKGQEAQKVTEGRLAEPGSQRDPYDEGESACEHDPPCGLDGI